MRKLCFVTGTRAEYGLIYWLLREVSSDPELQLQLVATGMHLAPEFGATYQVIEEDGFTIDWKVDMLLSGDSGYAMSKSVGLGIIGFTDAFRILQPDILVLTGDRFETLAAAQAAMFLNIPIAHLYGGEVTEGAIDESIRHAITKMAYIHFTATESYRKRVIQLGEAPERVFNYGAPGLDHLTKTKLLSRNELSQALQFHLDRPYFLVTYHPDTLGQHSSALSFQELLKALEQFNDYAVIITKPNADAGGRELIGLIEDYARTRADNVYVSASLGQVKYLSAMKYAAAVVGNSSSGIIEAPAMKVATVNIGDRQQGRLRSKSIVDCQPQAHQIVEALRLVLSRSFQADVQRQIPAYGSGGASESIKEILKNIKLTHAPKKKFYDCF